MTELSPSSLLNDNLASPSNVLPEECVDYLSFNFDAFDLYKCWRNATKHKDNIINGRRLENASWRKFFQLRFGLPTIDPAKLNWQKDSDVVWLYGPFVGLHHYEPLAVIQKAAEEFGSETELKSTTLKPALKKRPEPNDFLQQLRELYVKTRSTGLLTDEHPISVPTNTNRDDSFLVPPTGNRPEFSFSANKSASHRGKTFSDGEQSAFVNVLYSGKGTPPNKLATFLYDDDQISLSVGNEQQNRHIRFNENVEQARIIDNETEDSTESKQVRKVPPKPTSPKLLKEKAFLFSLDDEDDEDDEDEDFEIAGAAKVFGAVPAHGGVTNYENPIPININSSAFPSVQTPPFYAHSPVYSHNSPTPSGSVSSHTHANLDEFDAITGAVAGSTDWMASPGPGSGLLRRTQSEGNNFYIMARRLAESAPTPPISNHSNSPSPSIRTPSRTPSLRSSISQAPPSQKTPTLPPHIGSGLSPVAQLPLNVKSGDEDEDSEDDTIYLNSKLAFAALAHHRGSPPPKLGLRPVESESESEEEGLTLGVSKRRSVSDLVVDEKNISKQILDEKEPKLSKRSSLSNTSTTITSSLVRTSSWIASTYPSSARSFGQLLYGPEAEVKTERKLASNNEDIDSDFDEEHLKVTVDENKGLETDFEDGFRSIETESESVPDTLKNFGDVVEEIFGNVTRWASG
ncbi:hypothetical protein HK096_003111, partial [Nowakowskiella sp. JEL0078]